MHIHYRYKTIAHMTTGHKGRAAVQHFSGVFNIIFIYHGTCQKHNYSIQELMHTIISPCLTYWLCFCKLQPYVKEHQTDPLLPKKLKK
jgi:hypothetical protein